MHVSWRSQPGAGLGDLERATAAAEATAHSVRQAHETLAMAISHTPESGDDAVPTAAGCGRFRRPATRRPFDGLDLKAALQVTPGQRAIAHTDIAALQAAVTARLAPLEIALQLALTNK